MYLSRLSTGLPERYAGLRRQASRELKRCYQTLRAQRPRTVVFVAGCQRSGTNMLMNLLDASYETDVYHEHDRRAFSRYEMRETQIIAELHARSQAPVMVVKALCDLERLPVLCEEFAPARVLWIYRDYRDVVNSMLVSFRNQVPQVQRLASGKDTSWWGRALSPAALALLREVVTPDLDAASAAALQWFVRARMYFELGHERNSAALLLNYERLVLDPGAVIDEMNAFIGLRPRVELGTTVHRHSVGKRRSPSIRQDIAALCDSLLNDLAQASARSSGHAMARHFPTQDILRA